MKKIILIVYVIFSLTYIIVSLSLKNEDANKDGVVNSKDMLVLRNYLLKEEIKIVKGDE